MTIKPSNQLVKSALSGHSWLGLCVSALMYLICLTGTLSVFFEEFERWEQPEIEEYSTYSTKQIETALSYFSNRIEKTPESVYVVLPTQAVPRIHISGDGKEWFVNQNGSLSSPPEEGWTHGLKALHTTLHLPQTLGLIVVGALGAMLCGLIVSGLLAHPRIFKDAFRLRLGGNKRLEQADVHNRLGVWGTPFYLMIGLTGAYIGLISVLVAFAAPAFYDGDREAIIEAVYGGDPELSQPVVPFNIENAFETLAREHPDATPIYMVFQKMDTEQQFLEIAATLPGRLIYSEMYRFTTTGELLDHQRLSDGPVARQVAYSVYRLHFGHFGTGWTKIVYGLLGAGLTIIAATGVNIWLARRKKVSCANDMWLAMVWGTPLALAVSVITNNLWQLPVSGFWLTLLSSIILCCVFKGGSRSKTILIRLTGLSLVLVMYQYYLKFGSFDLNPAALKINMAIILMLSVYLLLVIKRFFIKR